MTLIMGVQAVLDSGRGINMGDGWETRRRREPGFDWLLIAFWKLRRQIIEVDTSFYKKFTRKSPVQGHANGVINPDYPVHVLAGVADPYDLSPDTIHHFELMDLEKIGPISHVKLNIFRMVVFLDSGFWSKL